MIVSFLAMYLTDALGMTALSMELPYALTHLLSIHNYQN